MDDFSKFIKDIRLSYDKESPIRKVVDAISQANTLQKVIYLNSERDRLQSECNSLILMKQLFPAIDISEGLRFRQELLNQCGQLLNQLGSDVITDETQITAADIERKRLEGHRGKQNQY